MALLPRKKWTNRLAWAVWKQRQNNKIRAGGDALRWFYEGDGVGSVISLDTPLSLVNGQVIKIHFKAVAVWSDMYIACSELDTDLAVYSDGTLLNGGVSGSVSISLDGISYGANVVAPVGVGFTLYIRVNNNTDIKFLGSRFNMTRIYDATMFDIELDGGAVLDLTVDEGPTSGGVIINNGSGGNATLLNEVVGDWYEA